MDPTGIVNIVLTVALIAVAVVLLVGIFSMFKGGAFNKKYSNVLMRWRIGLQAAAVVLLFLLWWLNRG